MQLLPVLPVLHILTWQQKELKKLQKQRTVLLKIETRGSGGAKNVLTDQEIADADCIIVAADAKVPMERFDGKKVIECQVSDGISKADQLIEQSNQRGCTGLPRSSADAQTSSAGNKVRRQCRT